MNRYVRKTLQHIDEGLLVSRNSVGLVIPLPGKNSGAVGGAFGPRQNPHDGVGDAGQGERRAERFGLLLAERNLKMAFHHSAIRAIQYFAEIRTEYQRLHRRKGKPIARALIAKELATIVYALLTKGVDFSGTFRGHQLTRTKKHTWPRLASPPCLTEAPKASSV